jgi:hypothetical protein
MFAKVGTTQALVGTPPNLQAKEGEFTTVFKFPTDHTPEAAAQDVVGAMRNHSDEPPVWVESDNKRLKDILCDHYGVDKRKKQTAAWGDA